MRLLLVEDDNMIGEAVRTGLRQEGFTVDWVREAEAGDVALRTEPYSLVLLDLGLPRKSGLDWLRELRRRGDATPVLVVTARDAVADRIAGLDGGADDYLVKPFDLEELAARVRAVLRRRAGRAEPLLQYGDLTLDPATRQATFNGQPVTLSAREYALLALPMQTFCKLDCKGLCPTCGTDLNAGDCGCLADEDDDRFDVLKRLLG